MKIAILIYRQIEHMYFAKIVEYAKKKKIQIDFFLLQSEFKNPENKYKSYQKPTRNKSPYISNKNFILKTKRKATEMIIQSKYDFFFSLHHVLTNDFCQKKLYRGHDYHSELNVYYLLYINMKLAHLLK